MFANIFLNIGSTEWIMIIAVVLLLFGGKKIPELMRGLGRGMREFNDAKNAVRNEFESGMREEKKPVQPVSNTAAPTETPTADTKPVQAQ